MPSAVRSAPAHPLVLAAAALIVVNDFVLRGHAPGWLTGKLSDVGWLVVAPVLVAALLARIGASGRVAKAGGLGLAGGFYIVLQVWPPLGAWFHPTHVADLGDLLVLPALLGAAVAWRGARMRSWAAVAALPALGAVLVADDAGFSQPGSVPCGAGMPWDAAVPLTARFASFSVPWDTDGFVRGLRLTDESGTDIPLVVTGSWSGVSVCARDGLRGDTAYTWKIGPWEGVSSNQLAFRHQALPTVRFRTLPGDGPPAADAAACAALVVDPDTGTFDRCVGGDSRVGETGRIWGDTGDDTGDDTDTDTDTADSGAR